MPGQDQPASETLAPPARSPRLEALLQQYGRLIRSVVARVGGRSVALIGEDIAQQVVISLWRRLEREQDLEANASYVYRAAVRETVRALRREASRASEPLGEANEGAPASGPSPFEAVHQGETADLIEASLRELLPDRERAVRAHLMGFDVVETMRTYGWPYQKTRNLIARGIADLRALLREKGLHD